MPPKYNLIAVIGPTARGKTAFAAHLANRIHGETISADSRQVYRQMDIGTGKDLDDFIVEGNRIPAYLIDIADPGYKYSVFEYQRDFNEAYRHIIAKNKIPVLCGGSGMYIDAATRQYRLVDVPVDDEFRKELSGKSLTELEEILSSIKELHNKTDTDTNERAIRAIEIGKYYQEHPEVYTEQPKMNVLYLGIIYDRETERTRITQRLESRFKQGMVEEVKQLLSSGIPAETLTYYGLEYRYITLYLLGSMTYETMKIKLNTAIHQFSKKQRTWFRKMEREGCNIHWIDGNIPMQQKLKTAIQLLEHQVT
jgi:tRNA dimethylallyltransferase